MKNNVFTSTPALGSRVSAFLKLALILVFAAIVFALFSRTGLTENNNGKTVNNPPEAVADFYQGNAARHQNSPGLLLNDSDPDADALNIDTTPVTQPSHGWVSIYPNGSFDYLPQNGWTGNDSFEYKVCDRPDGHPDKLCSTATVFLEHPNSPPIAVVDYYLGWNSGYSVTQATFGLLSNDKDINNDHFQIDTGYHAQNPSAQPAHGWVLFYLDGKFDYVMNDPGFTGLDSFQYRVCDVMPNASPGACSIATVYIWVLTTDRPVEDAGLSPCPTRFGEPVNVTNGNMFLQQTDYVLPGIGENIDVTRTYNSITQNAGVFGLGWTTDYDANVYEYAGANVIRLLTADARAVYFGSTGANQPFMPLTAGFYGQITKNTSGTYTLAHRDGSVHQFNSAGRLTSMTDRNGNQTTISYDTSNRLSSVTNPFNKTVTFTYDTVLNEIVLSDADGTIATYKKDQNNRLESVTYPDNSEYAFSYTTRTVGQYTLHLLTEVRDALNNILEKHDYDSSGRATTSEVDGGAEKYTANYSNPNLVVVTDALQRETKFHVTSIGSRKVVTKVEGICGCGGSSNLTTEFQYDNKLNVTKKIDANNHQTTFTYDDSGNILTTTDVTGTRTFTYNSYGQILTATDQMNGTATVTYNAQGRPLTLTNALNKTTTLDYFTNGELKSVTDARNKTTNYLWEDGNLKRITDANAKQTNFTYNGRGKIATVTNALNHVTTYQYDSNYRLKKVIYPDLKFVEYKYDLAGRIEWTQDARGNKTYFGYDTLSEHRLKTVTDPLNHTTTYGYDIMSNVTSITDAAGKTTDYTIDEFNRVKEVIYPPATTGATRVKETYTFDKDGHVKTHTDTANRVTTYDYDSAERLWKITNPNSEVTEFEYNARSQRTKVKDALNQQHAFTYDALGRQLTQSRMGFTMTYEYDAVGNLIKRTDYGTQKTVYTYDNLNRLEQIDYLDVPTYLPIGTVTYTYDDISRMLTAMNQTGTVSFTYDNRNRIASTTDVFANLIEYEYDENGNRTLLKLGGQTHSSYVYDAANRLTTLTDEASQNFTFGYDVTNKLTSKTLPNNVVTTYDYDGLSRLTRLKHQYGTTTLTDNQYTYNSAQQISEIAELAQTRTFTYDNSNRLTAATNPTLGNESYAYDDVGNRTASHRSSSYTHQANNQLVMTDTLDYGYVASGNMGSISDYSMSPGFFLWDYENRLLKAKNTGYFAFATVSYEYDALGRRVSRDLQGQLEKYTYDGFDVILDEDNSSGSVTYQNAPGIDNKLKLKTTGGTSEYFLQDHLGSTIALTNSSGSVTSSASYDSFGNPTGSLNTRYQFTGREVDSFTGLYYYRARWYDANVGRFINEDPIGFAGGDVNLYGYVGNNPINMVDPSGLSANDAMEHLREGVHRFGQGIINAGEKPAEFLIGMGDYFSGGTTRELRQYQGIDPAGLDCSRAYTYGGYAAVVVEVTMTGGGGIFRAGGTLALRTAMRSRTWIKFGYLSGRTLGVTTPTGRIIIQRGLSRELTKETIAHELVHRFFTPRSGYFVQARQSLNMWGYNNSRLLRGLEEGLAEGYAQYRMLGSIRAGISSGIVYPFAGGYVTVGGVAVEAGVLGGGFGSLVYLANR